MDQIKNRRIPLDEGFMDRATDDVVFSALSAEATYYNKIYYLTMKKARELYKQIAVDNHWAGTRTVRNHLRTLIELGYIQEEKMMLNDKETNVLTFQYEMDGSEYEFVERDLLRFMSHLLTQNAIKIYTYLRHRQNLFSDGYIFSYRELQNKLGYSTTTKSTDTTIKDILIGLKKLGLIDYEVYYEIIEDGFDKPVPIQRHKLTKVAKSLKELNLSNN